MDYYKQLTMSEYAVPSKSKPLGSGSLKQGMSRNSVSMATTRAFYISSDKIHCN